MATVYLKDLIKDHPGWLFKKTNIYYKSDVKYSVLASGIAIILDDLFDENDSFLTIDCCGVYDFMNVDFIFTKKGEYKTWTVQLINCLNKNFLAARGECAVTFILNGMNNCFICVGNSVKVRGNENIVATRGNGTVEVCGNDNEITCMDVSDCDIYGDCNQVDLYNRSRVTIDEKAVSNKVMSHDHALVINHTSSTQVVAKGSSIVKSVIYPYLLLENAIFHKINRGHVGKEICKRPINDTKGYFYKAVREDMTPFYNPDCAPYEVNQFYYPDKFDPNETHQCSNGIHFLTTLEDAVAYGQYLSDGLPFKILRLVVEFDDIAPIDARHTGYKYRAKKVFVDSVVPDDRWKFMEKELEWPQRVSENFLQMVLNTQEAITE